jgi:pheromone shutdown protein TraB
MTDEHSQQQQSPQQQPPQQLELETGDQNTPVSVEQEPIVEMRINDCVITLLGTAHVSKASADKVTELLRSGNYDSVAVELCKSRHNNLVDPDALSKLDLFQVIKQGKAAMVTANLALGAFQQRMADQLGIKPGAEMRAAIDTAAELELPVLLIDREIATTLKRVYRNVPWWQRLHILSGLIASVVSRQEVSEEEIERLKEGDILESTFTQFAEEAEDLFVPLVDERDRYMAGRLLQEATSGKHQRILVVIGAGHMNGMQQYLEHWSGKAKERETPEIPTDKGGRKLFLEQPFTDPQTTLDQLDQIPPPSRWPKMIPWLIVALIFVGFGIGFSKSTMLGWQMIADWVFINGGLAALGALIAMAHPLTIIGAFVAAPLTSLNPTIGAGMVTAAIEIMLRKPTVEDFSKLRTEASHLKGWWHNRVTRTLLIFIFSTLGSAIGTYVAGYRIFERLTS